MSELEPKADLVSLDIVAPKGLVANVPAVKENLPPQITDLLRRISEVDTNAGFTNMNGGGVVAQTKAVDVLGHVLEQYGKWLDNPNPVAFASSGYTTDYPQLVWEPGAKKE